MIKLTTQFDKIELGDAEKMMVEVKKILLSAVDKNFAQGGRPNGWQKTPGGQPSFLYKTGKLRSSIRGSSGDTWAQASTGVGYARHQQFGARVPVTADSRRFFWYMFGSTKDPKWKWMALSRKTTFQIPPRRFMAVTEGDKQAILKAVKNNLFTITVK